MHDPKVKPVCELYFNNKTNNFILVNYVRTEEYGGWTVSCGPFIHILQSEIKISGIDIILKNLKEFFYRVKTEKSEYEMMTKVQEQKFRKEHKVISIDLENENLISLLPMQSKKSGHIGKPEHKITVTLPCTGDKFYMKLKDAFEKCS